MRSNIIKCDACKKEHDAEYMLPSEWVTTIQNTIHGTQEEHHFCCKTPCLVKWATGTPMSAGDRVMFGGPSL